MIFVSDWQQCFEAVREILRSEDPIFLSRLGGSDTNALALYLEARHSGDPAAWTKVRSHIEIVERYNGFYARENREACYFAYLETLWEIYKTTSHTFIAGADLLTMYFPDNIHESFHKSTIAQRDGLLRLVASIDQKTGAGGHAFPYPFVEKLVSHPLTLMHVLAEVLVDKKVLLVSPLTKSIAKNFEHRAHFFRSITYPTFNLVLYQTPITYFGLPSACYPHQNWLETADLMKSDVEKLDFDVALLSCGSYALPLGQHIKNKLGRKAIYVGGILQMMFGVLGRRYAHSSFFMDQINSEYFIFPVERNDYLQHVPLSESSVYDGFGAYF